MITPRVIPVISLTGLAGLLLSGILAYIVVDQADDRNERECQRSVAAREDNRAMWEYAIDRAPTDTAAQKAQVAAFTAYLNKRLPLLTCVDNIPVPDDGNG